MSEFTQNLYLLGTLIGTSSFVLIPERERIYRISILLLQSLMQVIVALFFGPFSIYISFAIVYLLLLPFPCFGYTTFKEYIRGLIRLKEKVINKVKK